MRELNLATVSDEENSAVRTVDDDTAILRGKAEQSDAPRALEAEAGPVAHREDNLCFTSTPLPTPQLRQRQLGSDE